MTEREREGDKGGGHVAFFEHYDTSLYCAAGLPAPPAADFFINLAALSICVPCLAHTIPPPPHPTACSPAKLKQRRHKQGCPIGDAKSS